MQKIILFCLLLLAEVYSQCTNCGTTEGTPLNTWHKTQTKSVITFYMNNSVTGMTYNNGGQNLTDAEKIAKINYLAQLAAEKWLAAINSKGTIIQVQQASDYISADVKIDIQYNGISGKLGDGDTHLIIINGSYDFTDNLNNLQGYHDIFTLLIHEWGHVFMGGGHPPSTSESVMNYVDYQVKRYLTSCDSCAALGFYNPIVSVTVKNSFGAGDMKIDSVTTNVPAGGLTKDQWRAMTFPHTLEAVDQTVNGTHYEFHNSWNDNIHLDFTSRQISIPAQDNTYTAVFEPASPFVFQNSFVGVDSNGVIKANNIQYSAPYSEYMTDLDNVSIEAPDQTINSIYYTFNHWQDGSTLNPRTFNYSSGGTNTAYYTGKPLTVTNMHYLNVSAGNKIKIAWDEQPNNNVSKYYIYLKGKDSMTGEKWGPELRATLNRGTLSYTDPIYAYTDGYTMFLLRYDVRPYYSLEQSYADSNYSAIFGGFPRGLPKSTDAGIEKQIVSNGNTAPKDFDLFQNYPNPFNPTTQIKYALKEDGFVTIKVYDLLGKVVATLVNENKPAGVYTVDFDASRLSSGIYFYTIKTNNFFDRKKMILMK